MNVVVCPHCGNRRLVFSKVPKDVVVLLPCPACKQLVVLFRGQVIGVNRDILEHGTFEERRDHFAEIIAKFWEAGVLQNEIAGIEEGSPLGFDANQVVGNEQPISPKDNPITQEEYDRFMKIELKRIDEISYFRKHFG